MPKLQAAYLDPDFLVILSLTALGATVHARFLQILHLRDHGMRLRHAHRDAPVQKKHQQKMAPMDNPYPINAIVATLHAEK